MYKSLLKSSWVVVKDEEARVINSNELMEKKISELRRNMKAGDASENGESQTGFVQGIPFGGDHMLKTDAGAVSEEENVLKAEPVYEGPSPEELQEQAQAEIENMLEQARGEAEVLRMDAYESGRQEGFMAGQQESARQMEEQNRRLQERERQLESLYQSRIEDLEPMMIDTLTGIYEHVFHLNLDTFKSTILYLAGDALSKSESNKDFIVRVAKEDHKEVLAGKEILENMIAASSTIEIIADITLASGECLIETGGGIFDCGIGTELSELSKELKLLSFER